MRIAQQFLFYLVWTLLSGALATEAHAKGLSFSRAVSIVFLLNELEQLVYFQDKLETLGGKSNDMGESSASIRNPRIDFIQGLFSSSYCTFELIELQRIVFFLIFNLSCSISAVFYEGKSQEELNALE